MNKKNETDQERAQEAQRVLDRVTRESETIGTSSFARIAKKAGGHMAGADADQDDAAEVWGRRIGRSLGVVAAIILLVMLINWLLR